jgi:N-succinyl-L-ornithine transcarbamylase
MQAMKQFLSIKDVDNPDALVAEAMALKQNPLAMANLGRGKTLVLLFFNASLRTRLSTQKAAQNLGLNVLVMDVGKDGWQLEFEDGAIMNGTTQEHIREAAAVVSQYADIIGLRTFPGLADRDKDYSEEIMIKFVTHATVPVVSLESATLHPLQSLADRLTIEEQKPTAKPKVVLSWAPHPRALPQAVANSFAQWMNETDYEFVITHPEGYELDEQFTRGATIEYDQEKALLEADFVYVKNWSSYLHYGQIISQDANWMMTADKMALTRQAKFMHCLPVRRNVVVSDDVLEAAYSLVIEQAENRIYAAQAVLKAMLPHG